jgi:hypothetical protein
MRTRIIGSIIVSPNGSKTAEQLAPEMMLSRSHKVTKLEAVAMGDGGVCITIYGRDPLAGERLKLWSSKIFRLTRAQLIRTEGDPEMDERDVFFKEHDVRPEHIVSAAIGSDGDIITFCLYFDLPKEQ